jgi:hypothetical protein
VHQTERDHQALAKAAATSRIIAQRGLQRRTRSAINPLVTRNMPFLVS